MERVGVQTVHFKVMSKVTDKDGVRNVSEALALAFQTASGPELNRGAGCQGQGLGIGSCSDERLYTDHDLVESQDRED